MHKAEQLAAQSVFCNTCSRRQPMHQTGAALGMNCFCRCTKVAGRSHSPAWCCAGWVWPDPHLSCQPTGCHVTSTMICEPEAMADSPVCAFSRPLCPKCSLSCFSSPSFCRARYACCTHGSACRAAGGRLSAPGSARGGSCCDPSPASSSSTGLGCATRLVSERRPSGPAGWQKWLDYTRRQREPDHSRAEGA